MGVCWQQAEKGGVARVAGIDHSSDARDARYNILEQPKPFAD
jgi:hypothetical protein